jgi:hypothetical protein
MAFSAQVLAIENTSEGLFEIKSAKTYLQDHRYFLNIDVNYELSDESIRALKNGISLTLILQIDIVKERWYLWNEKIATSTYHYILRYHPLSNYYVVSQVNQNRTYVFANLSELLTTLGSFREIPLLEKSLLNEDQSYQVRLQTYLDIEALPPSLRTIAYFSREWRLISDVFNCALE